jgi:PAS domain S-box-containing protein
MRQEQDTTDLSAYELQRLVHELRLHQIELDLQNEELHRAQAALEATRSRYADLYEFAPVGYLSLDAEGIILEVNLTGSELLGMPRSRLRRRRFSDFVAPDVDAQDAFYRHRQQACGEATSCTCNLWMQRQDGAPFYAQLKSLVRHDGEHTPLQWHLALIDLTALREQAEAQLAWTAAIVESSHDAVIGATQEGYIVSWNTGAQHLYGYAAADVLGRPLAILASPECREETQRLLSTMQRGKRVEIHETLHQTQDDRRIAVSLTLSPIYKRDGSIIGVSMICRDITARKQREAQLRDTEQALRQSQTQLRRLAWRQHQKQEQERKRMAQEIHDELTQSLTLLHIDLAWLMERPGITPEVQERLQAIVAQVNDLDQVMHRIAMELRPPLLDDLGLLAALEWQLEEIHRRTDLTYTLQLPSAFLSLDPDRATVVFRIFQEALTNVIRHAKASHVDVQVIQDGEVIVLVVRDNGKGISAGQQAHRNALGLLGMRERAELWGGEVRVTGQAGRGTTVTVRMPCGSSPIALVDEP